MNRKISLPTLFLPVSHFMKGERKKSSAREREKFAHRTNSAFLLPLTHICIFIRSKKCAYERTRGRASEYPVSYTHTAVCMYREKKNSPMGINHTSFLEDSATNHNRVEIPNSTIEEKQDFQIQLSSFDRLNVMITFRWKMSSLLLLVMSRSCTRPRIFIISKVMKDRHCAYIDIDCNHKKKKKKKDRR